MVRLCRKNKKVKTIIIEDGVVNPNEMCIIAIPRTKDTTILYARKRDLSGPNVDRPRYHKSFNAMDELLADRASRAFSELTKVPKIVPRAERYDNFRKAMEKNSRRADKEAKEKLKRSESSNKPSRHAKDQSMAESTSGTSMKKASSTMNTSSFDETFAPLLSNKIKEGDQFGGNVSFRSPIMDQSTFCGSMLGDDYDNLSFQPDYSNYPQMPEQSWQFHSNDTYNPNKTFTIMPPDNRLFKQSKSFDFDRNPNFNPSYQSYQDEYADVMDSESCEQSCSAPAEDRNYYSLIEDCRASDQFSSCLSQDTRTRDSNSFLRDHELVNMYTE